VTRPNFIIFITDQHRADHLGCYGNPIVSTPVIDDLAQRGWRADEMHAASPICMPNRASLMTGRMPTCHGTRHNGIELSLAERTLPQALAEAGYRTAHVGKSHLQNIQDAPGQYPRPTDPPHSGEARTEEAGRHGQEVWRRWEEHPEFDVETPYYGFQTVDLCIEHGDGQYGHWRRWVRNQVKDADGLIGAEHAIPTPGFALTTAGQAWRTRLAEELYPTSWVAERAISRLHELAGADQPFFLYCSFPDPHHPFTPPGRYWNMYRPEDMPLPDSFDLPHDDLPPHVRWLLDRRDDRTAVKNSPQPFACTAREAREALALNYGSINFVDAAIGRVLEALRSLGLADDTVVLFTSDHGDFMGDHQLLLKGPIHYRGLTRVPFVWMDPAADAASGVSTALVQTTDIAPTILQRAGVLPWHGIQGRSLLPLMTGSADAWRESLLVEEEGQRYYMGFPDRVRMRSLLTARYRLSVYDGVSWGELYDRERDPHEVSNLWNDPACAVLRADLTEQLAHSMISHAEISPAPTKRA
jgi:arylsulfatase A-like enzyme